MIISDPIFDEALVDRDSTLQALRDIFTMLPHMNIVLVVCRTSLEQVSLSALRPMESARRAGAE